MARSLRDILPKGLYWRTLLIFGLPAAIMQLIISVVFFDDHWRATSKRMAQGVAADVALLVDLYERDPTQENFAMVHDMAYRLLFLDVALERGAALEKPRCLPSFSVIDRYFRTALEQRADRPIWYDASCRGNRVEIRVPVADNAVMRVHAFRDRVQARSGPLFVAWIFGATMFLGIVSILFIRNQVRPIETLANAMEQFGRGQDPGMFRVRGAREVRQATHAFFDMRARIKRHIEQRAQLLAGVSHDLRTPLTRLRLQFALMPPSDAIEDAKRDLADMERTLDEYLAFARGQFVEETEETDIAALVREAAAQAERGGAKIDMRVEEGLTLQVRANAVRRALANLIDNAAAHGQRMTIEVKRIAEDRVGISVDDDGPGISEDQYEEAFKPFSRLDETRTRNQKGVGLGLAIARDVARAHGGDVMLSRSAMGGLRATLNLPAPAH
jgi:two-component system osmolarity sensor histidine kinase EnvZ